MSKERTAYEAADAEYNRMIRETPDVYRRSNERQREIDEALSRRLYAGYALRKVEPNAII